MAGKSDASILIVDDHPLVREGLIRRLQREPGLKVCGEAADAPAAMKAVANLKPDIAIVDISLPGRDGIELTKDLRARFPETRVLVLSMHDESLYAERALRAGAAGYVMKHEPTEALIAAIRRVLAGHIVVGNGALDLLLTRGAGARRASDKNKSVEVLSDRELEVFRLLGQGRSRLQIARTLELSIKTVDSHFLNIRDKLGLRHAVAVLRSAIRFVEADEKK